MNRGMSAWVGSHVESSADFADADHHGVTGVPLEPSAFGGAAMPREARSGRVNTSPMVLWLAFTPSVSRSDRPLRGRPPNVDPFVIRVIRAIRGYDTRRGPPVGSAGMKACT